VANFSGRLNFWTRRSSWSYRIQLVGVNDSVEATSTGSSPLFNMRCLDMKAVVYDPKNMAGRPLHGVIAVLLLVARYEPSFYANLTESFSDDIAGVKRTGLAPIVCGVAQVGRRARRHDAASFDPAAGMSERNPSPQSQSRGGYAGRVDHGGSEGGGHGSCNISQPEPAASDTSRSAQLNSSAGDAEFACRVSKRAPGMAALPSSGAS